MNRRPDEVMGRLEQVWRVMDAMPEAAQSRTGMGAARRRIAKDALDAAIEWAIEGAYMGANTRMALDSAATWAGRLEHWEAAP